MDWALCEVREEAFGRLVGERIYECDTMVRFDTLQELEPDTSVLKSLRLWTFDYGKVDD